MTSATINVIEFNALKNEVKSLKELVRELIETIKREKYEDVTSEELMLNASSLFDVSSKRNPDDDNIASPSKIKPLDLSKYA